MQVELTKKDISILKRALIVYMTHKHPNDAQLIIARREILGREVVDELQNQFPKVPFFDEYKEGE